MNNLDIYVALAFRILPENGGGIPFHDILNNPKKILPKNGDTDAWEVIGKLNENDIGLPYQAYKFANNVIINIQPDFAEIKQDATQGQAVDIENICQIAEAFSGIAMKNTIQAIGLNYGFLKKDNDCVQTLKNKLQFPGLENPNQVSCEFIYPENTEYKDSLAVTIKTGNVMFPPNPKIDGILFNINYNRDIEDVTRLQAVSSFVKKEQLEQVLNKLKAKAATILCDL